jgi:hypothetical protein
MKMRRKHAASSNVVLPTPVCDKVEEVRLGASAPNICKVAKCLRSLQDITTIKNATQYNDNYVPSVLMLSVILLGIIKLGVFILSVVMLNALGPLLWTGNTKGDASLYS